jgi:hypothetical protein
VPTKLACINGLRATREQPRQRGTTRLYTSEGRVAVADALPVGLNTSRIV